MWAESTLAGARTSWCTTTLSGRVLAAWFEGMPALSGREAMAGSTGLEPAASGVTGRRSNQLNYDPAKTTSLT